MAGSSCCPRRWCRSGRCSATATSAALLSTGTSRGGRAAPAGRGALARRADARRPSPAMVVADDEELRRLPAGVAVHRAGLALVLGDLPATVTHAQRALDLLDEDDDLGRGAATALIGLASWASGDLEAAHAAYAECTTSMQRAGHLADVLGCSITLADIRVTQGRLREAMRTYEQALQLGRQHGGPVLRGTRRHVRRDERAPPRTQRARSSPGSCWRGARSWASTPGCRRTGTAGGSRWPASVRPRETDRGARPARRGGAAVRRRTSRPTCARSRPCRARVPGSRRAAWTTRSAGRASRDCPPTDDLSYLREFEHVTLARALLAQNATEHDRRTLDEATGCWSACCGRPRKGAGRAASSRSWCCRRSRTANARRRAPPHWRHWNAPWRWPSRRATSGSSSTRARPWRLCSKRPQKHGIARDYVRRLLDRTSAGPRTERPRAAGPGRAAEPARARRAPAARNRPGRSGHRPRARRVAEHRADPHEEHLREARREQPAGRRTPGRGARPDVSAAAAR